MFGAEAMLAVRVHLMEMKVKQLAEELEAREAPRSGRKRALQLRLRALIISAHVSAAVGSPYRPCIVVPKSCDHVTARASSPGPLRHTGTLWLFCSMSRARDTYRAQLAPPFYADGPPVGNLWQVCGKQHGDRSNFPPRAAFIP